MKRWSPALLLALVLCAPAEAATTVARNGDFTLRAAERDGRLCMTLRRDGRYRGRRCGRIPRSPQRPLVIEPDVGLYDYAAAVPPSVRTAEVETKSGSRHRRRTAAAPGFVSRFVLIPKPPAAVFVRYYGADGALLGIDAGPLGYIGFDNEVPIGPDASAHTEPLLSPTPDDPDRLTTIACLDFVYGNVGGGFCDIVGSGFAMTGSCRQPHRVGGIVDANVAGIRLRLGSGVQVVLPTRPLPAVFGGRRAVFGEPPPGAAIRSAEALDAGGAVIGRTTVGMPPANQPCAGDEQGDDEADGVFAPLPPPASGAAVASAGGATLLAADQAERLCVALGALRARRCPPPPVDSDRPRLLRRARTVAGVLSGDAARVTLRLDRGGPVTVATTAGTGYQGRWAGRVKFFAASVPIARRVTGAVVRNADGTIIGISARGVPEVSRRVLAERGGRGLQLVRRSGDPPCLTAFAAQVPPAPRLCTDLSPGTPIDGPVYAYSGVVTVPCEPRRAIAYGRMPDDHAAPTVRLAGGRTVPSRRIRLRGEDAWVAFLPDARVRSLRSGRFGVRLALPSADAECGYSIRRAF